MIFSHLSSDQNKIKEEVKRTFQKINAKQAFLKTDKNDIIDFLNKGNDTEPMIEIEKRKLSVKPHEWAKCNKKLFDDEELHEALFKHMNGSSFPGPDGFTVNWLRHFWPEMKDLTREALNSSTNGLTKTLRLAIIKILRKGSKDPTEASSYRPISLLSIFYKLASCVLTRRIKPVVEKLIGKEQKAYIKSNNIGSCILNLLNMMKFEMTRKKHGSSCLLILTKPLTQLITNFWKTL